MHLRMAEVEAAAAACRPLEEVEVVAEAGEGEVQVMRPLSVEVPEGVLVVLVGIHVLAEQCVAALEVGELVSPAWMAEEALVGLV